ncbi:ribosome small subunit-dependent GTPase A [Rippkaea orientalis PCC 8801]|uniref:Small ribosomal subunit biogenesis GTPase RsgA n=1 Tax=Rippkaea orientalis (strain PCC 8801 / RF-1) TaxID=41431 RepID=B7JY66_RIPO1|nr:small ribosomal subunit biogenesis GTPase RsgA [Rippkaea orientalis]ACK67168.1 ribosome small subunit-dependent GTPase A [Rippkaea orientalis PCC 8801]
MSKLNSHDLASETVVSEIVGTVVAVQANFYQVRLDQDIILENSSKTHYLLCTRRTRLKKIGQKVMVGDRVIIEEPDYQDGRGAIAQVFPRKTELSRPPVANAEQILLVFALENPPLDPWQLSRFLVKAESTSLSLCLCFNKLDLITDTQRQQWQERLEKWGYKPLFISIMTDQGLEALTDCLRGKITILAGPSGVGKSSLINTLIPEVEQRVGKVSGKLNKGRHTTRHVELFELPGGGLLADTPGFNQPDLDCDPQELALYFPEAKAQLNQGNCQFNDCLHRGEPNCVINNDWERYEHYLMFLEEAINRQETLQKMGDEETNLKLKIKASGQEYYEPKLETKKYRRRSRREKHQTLQGLYDHQSLDDFEHDNDQEL